MRNHSMPLEALHYDVTPLGLHYLLTHFDIPAVDASTWKLMVGGAVRRPLELDLDQIRSRPATTLAVTLECAGNGRARLSPRPLSQPWLGEAVGNAEWTGTPLGPVLRRGGPGRRPHPRRLHRAGSRPPGWNRPAVRAQPHHDRRNARRGDARLRDQRPGAAPAARLSAPLDRPRLVRDDSREMAAIDHGRQRGLRGLSASGEVPGQEL